MSLLDLKNRSKECNLTELDATESKMVLFSSSHCSLGKTAYSLILTIEPLLTANEKGHRSVVEQMWLVELSPIQGS